MLYKNWFGDSTAGKEEKMKTRTISLILLLVIIVLLSGACGKSSIPASTLVQPIASSISTTKTPAQPSATPVPPTQTPLSPSMASIIDVLHSIEQPLITSSKNGDLVIRNLSIKDYPIIIRLTK